MRSPDVCACRYCGCNYDSCPDYFQLQTEERTYVYCSCPYYRQRYKRYAAARNVKSTASRGNNTEIAMEVYIPNSNMAFVEKLRAVDGVEDVTAIQYNGEYHD